MKTVIIILLLMLSTSIFAQQNPIGTNMPSCTIGQYWGPAPVSGIVNGYYVCDNGNLYPLSQPPSSVPSGMLAFISSGTCPTGWTENDNLATYNILVTTSANGDVGTAGGSNSYTPAGTASINSLTAAAQTFTGSSTTVPAETINSLTAAAQTFTGTLNQTTSATSAGTPTGTNTGGAYTEGTISWPVGVPTNAGGAFTDGAISWPTQVPTASGAAFSIATTHEGSGTSNYVATTMGGTLLASGTSSITLSTQPTIAWPSGHVPTVAAGTFTQPTISWPVGVPTISAGVFNQPVFTGNSLATHTHVHASSWRERVTRSRQQVPTQPLQLLVL